MLSDFRDLLSPFVCKCQVYPGGFIWASRHGAAQLACTRCVKCTQQKTETLIASKCQPRAPAHLRAEHLEFYLHTVNFFPFFLHHLLLLPSCSPQFLPLSLRQGFCCVCVHVCVHVYVCLRVFWLAQNFICRSGWLWTQRSSCPWPLSARIKCVPLCPASEFS